MKRLYNETDNSHAMTATIGELKEKLKNYPDDMLIYISTDEYDHAIPIEGWDIVGPSLIPGLAELTVRIQI